MNFDKKAFQTIWDDTGFKKELSDFLQMTVEEELNSPKEEIDSELIEECTDLLLSLYEDKDDSARFLVPLLSSKKLIRRAQNSGFYSISKGARIALTAAVIAGLLAGTNAVVSAASGVNPIEYIGTKVQETLTDLGIIKDENNTEIKEKEITEISVFEAEPTAVNTDPETEAATDTEAAALDTTQRAEATTASPAVTAATYSVPNKTPAAAGTAKDGATKEKSNSSTSTTAAKSPESRQSFTPYIRLDFQSGFKTEYLWGEPFDTSGLTVTYYDKNGKPEVINPALCTITGYNKTVIGEQTITVKYAGCEESFTVTLTKTETPAEKVITGVEGTAPTKQLYTTDDTRLMLAGLKVRISYSDGSFSKWYSLFDAKQVGTVDFSVTGEHTVTLRIDDKADFTYTIYIEPAYTEPVTEPYSDPVTEPTTQQEEPTTVPSTEPTTEEPPAPRTILVGIDAPISCFQFNVGDNLEAGNIYITEYYSDESTRKIYYNDHKEDFTIEWFDTSEAVTNKLFKITYKGFTQYGHYSVAKPAEPTTEPTTEPQPVTLRSIETDDDYYTFYVGDEDIDIYINAYYSDKTTEYLSWKNSGGSIRVYGLNTDTASSSYKTFTVTYKGKQTTAHYRVLDISDKEVVYAEFISNSHFKFLYYEGEPLGYSANSEGFENYTSTKASFYSGNVEYKMRRIHGDMLPLGISCTITVRYSDGNVQLYYANELRFEGYDPYELGFQKINVYDKGGNYLLSYLVFVYGDEGYCPLFRMDYNREIGNDVYMRFAQCIGNGNLKSLKSSGVTADLGDGQLGIYQGNLTLRNGTVYPLEVKNVRKISSVKLTDSNKLYMFNADDPSSFNFGDDTMTVTYTDGGSDLIPLNDLSATYFRNNKMDLLSDSRNEVTSSFGSALFMLDDDNYIGRSNFSNNSVAAKIFYFRNNTANTLTLSIYGRIEGVESDLTFDTDYTEHLFLWNHSGYSCVLNAIENSVPTTLKSVEGVNWGTPGVYRAKITVTYLDREYVFYKDITITD